MHRYFYILFLLPFIYACNQSGNVKNVPIELTQNVVNSDSIAHYFNGEFTYYGYTAGFEDCATGRSFAIIDSGALREVEEQYLKYNPTMMEALNCQIKGYFVNKFLVKDIGEKQIVITELIGFDPTIHCISENKITGIYIADSLNKDVQMILTIKPDYTYNYNRADKNGKPSGNGITGNWFRVSKDKIIFETNSSAYAPDYFDGTILFNEIGSEIPMKLLFGLGGKSKLVFEKKEQYM